MSSLLTHRNGVKDRLNPVKKLSSHTHNHNLHRGIQEQNKDSKGRLNRLPIRLGGKRIENTFLPTNENVLVVPKDYTVKTISLIYPLRCKRFMQIPLRPTLVVWSQTTDVVVAHHHPEQDVRCYET